DLFISSENLEDIFKLFPYPSIIWKKVEDDFILINYNNAADRITNGDIGIFVGKKASEFYRNSPEMLRGLNQCFDSRKKFSKEMENAFKPSKAAKIFRVTYDFISPNLVFVYAEDITEKKKLELQLEEAEERFRILIDKAVPAFAINDLEGNILMVNDLAVEMLGYSKEELLQMNITNIALEIIPLEHMKKYWEKMEIGEHVETTGMHKRKDGSALPAEEKLIKLRFKNKPAIAAFVRDISKQIKEVQELRGSEELYQLISENANDIISIINSDTRFTYCNEAFKNVLGYAPEELIGTSIFKIVHPEDLDKIYQTYESLIETGLIKNETRFRSKNGTYKWLESIGKGVFDKDKNLTKLIVIARDITGRKEAELKLKESEERYRLISEDADELICIHNNKFELEYFNKATHTRLLGYTADEMSDIRFKLSITHKDDLKLSWASYTTCLKEGKSIYQHRVRHKNGNYLWFESKGKVFLGEDGSKKLLFISRDITDRKEAEQKLEESEKKYRELFEKSPLSHWEEDFSKIKKYIENLKVQGVDNLREYLDENPEEVKKIMMLAKVLDVNKKTLEMFKFDTKKDLLKGLDGFFTDDAIQTYKEGMIAFSEGETRFEYELVVQTSDNQKLNILTIGEIVSGYEKNWSKVLNSLIDITALKKTEQLLKESEENFRHAYERESFYKDLFTHDMSNILQGMLTSLEIYEIELNSHEISPTSNKMLKIFKDQVNRAISLVSNVRKFSELDQSQLVQKKIDIREIVDKAYNVVLNQVGDKKINLQTNYSTDFFTVKADDFLLDVFENLLYNSVKHNNNREIEIIIKSSTIQKEDGRFLKLEFIDNGVGIPDSRKESILNRGIKEDKSVSGIGLGLSLVKKILENYNAEIYVENRIREDYTKGSNFILNFPVKS
ncbi:MAG: PAS domain S-box protein, partial [Candidatus Hermodarchaeota archaeon]